MVALLLLVLLLGCGRCVTACLLLLLRLLFLLGCHRCVPFRHPPLIVGLDLLPLGCWRRVAHPLLLCRLGLLLLVGCGGCGTGCLLLLWRLLRRLT
jgi:hypothetical protein